MIWDPATGSLDFATLHRLYQAKALTPEAVVDAVYDRIAARGDDHVWISLLRRDEVLARAAQLPPARAFSGTLPSLWGLPFAIKDNIDLAGVLTTAACPAYTYTPDRSATVVERLTAAGAIAIGKTNLDQFATGLVGVRSPYGVPRNPFHPAYIPGGSSSGSAVAVSAGLVSFALGTDTAGSGRVPAAFCNIVGLKPTRGLISAAGVVPACRSLDCLAILALTAPDAAAVFSVAAGADPLDPYSRAAPLRDMARRDPTGFRFGVPDRLEFFGDGDAAQLYDRAISRLEVMGGTAVEIAFAPFAETARLLYEGPWVAERLAVVDTLLATQPESVQAVTRRIIEGGAAFSAVDAFRAFYRLQTLRAQTQRVWDTIDCLVVPTTPTIYCIDAVEADPIQLNNRLGMYANFANLLDLAAIAVPTGFYACSLPAGITLIAPAFHEHTLVNLAAALHRRSDLPLGATGHPMPR